MGVIYKNDISYGGSSSSGGQGVQVSSLPTPPSIEYANKIYQYIGTTDSNYTNGYFYKCVENNGTYIWQQIPVAPADVNFSVRDETLVITTA